MPSAVVALLLLAPRPAARAAPPVGLPGTAPSAEAGLAFVMPAGGSFIPGGPVIVAGRLPAGAAWVNLLLDGEPVAAVACEKGSFSASITPSSGSHELEARSGDLSAKLRFTYAVGGRGAAPYRYHRPVLEARCAECHTGLRRRAANAEATTCKGCHRSIAVIYPFVHGPVAVGKCLVCHDPHGSSWPALLPADAKTLCTSCHDQPATLDHVEQGRSKVCHLCHNPHASMNKKLLYDIVR